RRRDGPARRARQSRRVGGRHPPATRRPGAGRADGCSRTAARRALPHLGSGPEARGGPRRSDRARRGLGQRKRAGRDGSRGPGTRSQSREAGQMSGPRRIAPGRIIQDVAGAIALLRGKDHAHAASGGVKGQQMPPLPMHINASMLMMDFFVGSALGYPFWIIAARLFDPADVGLGSAALSGLRLCMLLALIGIGSAIVLLLPRNEHDPSDVVSTALMLAVTSGLAVAVGFIVITGVLLGELK